MKGGAPLGRLATAVLVAAGLPAAAVLVLASREVHAGLSADQFVVFLVLPALWLIALGRASRLPLSARASVALLLVSLGFATVVAETLSGVWLTRASATARPSLHREVLRLRDAGVDAFPKIPGNSLVDSNAELIAGGRAWHPVTPAPGGATVLLCNENGPLVTYEADWAGFDNPDSAWTSGIELVLVGDSYTAGVCVGGQSIGARLRARWPTLNLGTSGAGPLQELAILREYVTELQPRVVVWIYYEGNDLWDLGREEQRAWLTAYLDPMHRQGLAAHPTEVDAAYRSWIDSLVAVESVHGGAKAPATGWSLRDLPSFASLRAITRFGVRFPSRESALGGLPRVLARAHEDVAGWGGRLFLAYMPAYERYDALVGEPFPGKDELKDFAARSGIPFVDLDEAFRAMGDPRDLWASPRGHLSVEGYRVAAEAIARAVESSLLPHDA
jgi:lysophospholipase L1-like esterase